MTFPTKLTDNLYTSKDGKLSSYGNVDQLDTLGKYDLFRLDKVSDNGLAITLCMVCTTKHTSKVSKASSEKGVQPVITEVGEPLVFGLNVNAKEKDGKENPDYALAKQLLIILDENKVEVGKVYFAKMDMGSVAPKSSEKMVRMIALDAFSFIPAEDVNFSKAGQDEALWAPAIEKISGEKFIEQKSYGPRATKDQVFIQNIEAVEKISPEELRRAYLSSRGGEAGDKEDFEMFCSNVRMSILLNF